VGARQHLRSDPKLEDGMTPAKPSRSSLDILLLAGFCGFLFLFGLSYFGLVGADEPRYAQVAREMLARHDWISPTFEGKPWLEKPPLYYWQAMVAFRLFGVSDWAARLPSAFDATLMVVAVYLFLRRLHPGFHLDGALIVASSAGVIGFARAASTDMPLTATFAIAMLAWYAWFETRLKSYLAVSYFFLALGVLAKGPVAIVLAGLIVAGFAFARRERNLISQTLWFPGILLLAAVVLPWYVLVQIRNPNFFRIFILEHNLARFGTNLYHHPEPFWYYIPVTMIGLFPWTVFGTVACWKTGRCWLRGERDADDTFGIFLLIWLLVPVLFFSLSRSKLPGYIVPSVPAGALLVAEYVRREILATHKAGMWQISVHAVLASLILIPAMMVHYILLQQRIPWNRAAVPVAIASVCSLVIALTLRKSGLRMLRFMTLIPLVLAFGVVIRAGSPLLDISLSARPVISEIAKLKPDLLNQVDPVNAAVFEAPRETEYGLAFYLNRHISRYERHEVPSSEHVVIAPSGSQAVVQNSVPGRRVAYLGSFKAQRLDCFSVGK